MRRLFAAALLLLTLGPASPAARADSAVYLLGNVPTATTGVAGKVKPDGTSIAVDVAGKISTLGAPPTGSATGDLSGSYPNPTVAKVNGTGCATGFTLGPAGCAWAQTASSSATLDFTGLDGTYGTLSLHCHGIVPATDGADFYIRFGTGGTPTWQTANYAYSYVANTSSASTPIGQSSTSDAAINLGAMGLYNGAGDALATFRAQISDLAATGYHLMTFTSTGHGTGAGPFHQAAGSGAWTGSTAAITGIRVMMTAGNITSGTCSLYGRN